MAARPTPADIAGLSFEDALAELETIVRQLEAGQGKLDDNISAYERGALLRAPCEAKLREAQARGEMVSRAADGTVTAQPATFD
ncbi:exodeoxyribonuclease VII small subunit [Inquilinus sp. Marseille-Q2685]|uniref:exodeoxyribonuclease VII small subunit n=1 Tax=Inquilinus sp. Marseille-Q2685 TaxID=2866581 RepID=UPI001CE458B3|nr:exodeoxyribonuclease VII small subunit [Inquilinus sp. Marseille-Q2685]